MLHCSLGLLLVLACLFSDLTGLFWWGLSVLQCKTSDVTPQMMQSWACTQSPWMTRFLIGVSLTVSLISPLSFLPPLVPLQMLDFTNCRMLALSLLTVLRRINYSMVQSSEIWAGVIQASLCSDSRTFPTLLFSSSLWQTSWLMV